MNSDKDGGFSWGAVASSSAQQVLGLTSASSQCRCQINYEKKSDDVEIHGTNRPRALSMKSDELWAREKRINLHVITCFNVDHWEKAVLEE